MMGVLNWGGFGVELRGVLNWGVFGIELRDFGFELRDFRCWIPCVELMSSTEGLCVELRGIKKNLFWNDEFFHKLNFHTEILKKVENL